MHIHINNYNKLTGSISQMWWNHFCCLSWWLIWDKLMFLCVSIQHSAQSSKDPNVTQGDMVPVMNTCWVLAPTYHQRNQDCYAHRDILSMGRMYKPLFSIQKARNWKLLIFLWFALSVGPGYFKIPKIVLEEFISINDPNTICITKGSHKFPQPGPELPKSPHELSAICITKPMPDLFLGL